jgi:hypothetical protein
LNIKKGIRDPAHYLLYHRTFEAAHAQGGLTGYAHLVDLPAAIARNAETGMAIDVPFGLVDFAEIMSLSDTGTSAWFNFLNLGFKLSPTAGTDYPVGGVPGTVRNYVHIDKPFTPQAWFTGLKQGRTFVTSGPMLEISVNGQGIGSELRVKSGDLLSVTAKASMNPDVGALQSLELIEQGEVVKVVSSQSAAAELELGYEIHAKHGTWLILRARGRSSDLVALSAPIYVFVDGQSFWKRSEVPSIVAMLKTKMQTVFQPSEADMEEGEEAQKAFAAYWEGQQGFLKARIERASAFYDELVRRDAASSDSP